MDVGKDEAGNALVNRVGKHLPAFKKRERRSSLPKGVLGIDSIDIGG